jgi:hypothetical protein
MDPHEFDLVAMLANSGLCHHVLALVKLYRKKTSGEKKLERLKRIIDCPAPNGATLGCVSRLWMAQSAPVSYRIKEFPNTCSEYQRGRIFLRNDDVINNCSELLRQDFEGQRDQDRSCRIRRARMSALLDNAEEVFV